MSALTRRQLTFGTVSAFALGAIPVPGRTTHASEHDSVALVRFAWWSDVATPTP